MSENTIHALKVLNPRTGKWILKESGLYKKLKAEGVLFGRGKRMPRPVGKQLDAEVTKTFRKYPVVTHDGPWGQSKPTSVEQRRSLKEECGDSCFLIAGTTTPKFPVCNKLPPSSNTKDPRCTYNCKGIKGAASRAGEWKYKKVLEEARKLGHRSGCYV